MGTSHAGAPLSVLHGPPALLRARRLRARGPRWRLLLLLIRLLQGIEDATAGRWRHRTLPVRPAAIATQACHDDRTRFAVVACVPGQEEAGDEETHREHRSRSGQQVGCAAARHEPGAAANTEAAAFGFLQQAPLQSTSHTIIRWTHDNDSLHLYLPSQTQQRRRPAASSGVCGV